MSIDPAPQLAAWQAFEAALNATGREMYYSICPHTPAPPNGTAAAYRGNVMYAAPAVWSAAQRQATANSILVEYMNTFDEWFSPRTYGRPEPGGLLTNIDAAVEMTQLAYSVPGSWNDLDMLEICNYGEGQNVHAKGGMTLGEYESHYAVWAVLASPLILSSDLRVIQAKHPDCFALMTNAELVAVNQDAAALAPWVVKQAFNHTPVVSSSDVVAQVFARPLSGDRTAVVLFNRAEAPQVMAVTWEELRIAAGTSCAVRDVLNRSDLPDATVQFTATVAPHGVVFVVLSPNKTLV